MILTLKAYGNTYQDLGSTDFHRNFCVKSRSLIGCQI